MITNMLIKDKKGWKVSGSMVVLLPVSNGVKTTTCERKRAIRPNSRHHQAIAGKVKGRLAEWPHFDQLFRNRSLREGSCDWRLGADELDVRFAAAGARAFFSVLRTM